MVAGDVRRYGYIMKYIVILVVLTFGHIACNDGKGAHKTIGIQATVEDVTTNDNDERGKKILIGKASKDASKHVEVIFKKEGWDSILRDGEPLLYYCSRKE
jgi:hypothetical protein